MKHDGDVQKVKHVCVGYRQTHLYFIVDKCTIMSEKYLGDQTFCFIVLRGI